VKFSRLFALACLLPLAAQAAPIDELNASIIAIRKVDRESGRDPAENLADLETPIRTLTKLIDEGAFDAKGEAFARYWRGYGTDLVNQMRLRSKREPDRALARETLADFDWVAGHEREVPAAGVAQALYGAGRVLRNYLGSTDEAYRYWGRCAERDHAGCQNIMAAAKLTGVGKVAVDLPGAVELHRRVYDTGTGYNCAGSYSALAIGEIVYFGGLRGVTVTDLDWVGRARDLVAQVVKERGLADFCGSTIFAVTEYLMRLDRGESRPELLRIELKPDATDEKATLDYLSGRIGEPAFRDLAGREADKDSACRMYFTAYWHAEIRKNRPLAQEYRRKMLALGGDYCGNELALVRLKYGE